MNADRSNRQMPRGKVKPTKNKPALPSVVLTGERLDDKFRIEAAGTAVLLSAASFQAVIRLACAALESESGFLPAARNTIYRLRKALDAQAGVGTGQELIHTGGGEEYRLAIPRAEFSERIRITACFYELVAKRIVTQQQADLLRKHCGKGKLRA